MQTDKTTCEFKNNNNNNNRTTTKHCSQSSRQRVLMFLGEHSKAALVGKAIWISHKKMFLSF